MHFVVLSHILPPSPSGQSVALFRILSEINQNYYYLINSGNDDLKNSLAQISPFQLQAQYYHLQPRPTLCFHNNFFSSRFSKTLNFFLKINSRVKSLSRVVRQEKDTTAIIACSGDLFDIPAGFLVSKMMRIPFYAYIFDDYVFQWTGYFRLFAKIVSPYIFKHSEGIIGPNEFICEEYQRRYDVKSTLVRNPCDKKELEKETYQQWPAESGNIKIVYTGAVYHANFDCFNNLIKALEKLPQFNLELHIFTAQPQELLESQGIQGKYVHIHSHVSYNNILEQQHKADILFLPLAFESPIPEVIRTSAPGKMGEYLASGRPVLAHVPSNSFVAYYFRKYKCGFVVDQNEPNKLAEEIKKLISDDMFRGLTIENARQQVRIDYSPEIASRSLIACIQKDATTNQKP